MFEKSYLHSAPGIVLDFGVLKKEIYDFTDFGFSVHNIGKMSALKNEATPLPFIINSGLSIYILDFYGENFTVTPGAQWIKNEKLYLKIGFEYYLNDYIHLRGGTRNGNESILWTTGFGLNFNSIKVDYAYAPFEYHLGSSNRISLRINY